MLEHGGRRRAAAQRFGIPEADWLDLSTGINPAGYPVPPIPAEDWLRLPEDDDGLLEAARDYYGSPRIVALAGSQPAIERLPALLPRGRVGVLAPTYAEHPLHWQRAGHEVVRLRADALVDAADTLSHLVLCRPNNPDATCLDRAALIAAAERLARRDGHLLVDEAFADATPAETLAPLAGDALPNLVVLRSLGKFFGLAGARVGFVAARPELCAALAEAGGPWPISGPARVVARTALADTAWQAATRQALAAASARLAALLAPLAAPGAVRATPLFAWLPTPDAAAIAGTLARRAILVRHFAPADGGGLRFGLPGDEAGWIRLAAALADLAPGSRR